MDASIEINYKIIGQTIKKLRLENQMTQAELAEASNLSITYISHIENNKRKASLSSLIIISTALNTSITRILNGSFNNNLMVYTIEFEQLFDGCTVMEKEAIFNAAKTAKKRLLEEGLS